ncbi:MAG: hypothetical protein QOI34_348 [Verrucomicrobiota bacterium]
MRPELRILILFASLICVPPVQSSIVAGQLDDFQDGTTQNWMHGGGGAPAVVNVGTGGPAGAGDSFLRATSNTSGPGPRLTTFNLAQWTGDYIGQGITTIEMDLENLGFSTLSVRLAFRPFNGPSSTPGYLSSAFTLAPGQWQHATFSIAMNDLISIGGPSDYGIFFGNVGELRIINEAGASNLTGDLVTAQLGIDNIHAVPEPNIGALLCLAGLSLILRRSRR